MFEEEHELPLPSCHLRQLDLGGLEVETKRRL